MENKIASRLLERFEKANSERKNYETVWQKISDYVLPHRGDFNTLRSPGDNTKRSRVFDTTAEQSNNLLSSSLYGGLVSPSTKWFSLMFKDRRHSEEVEIDEYPIYRWLENASDEMLELFNSADSSFPSQVHEFFLSLCSYGTAAMYVEDGISGIKFSTIHLSEITVLENSEGVVDTVYRKFSISLRQAVQMWGLDSLHPVVQKEFAKAPDSKIDIIHCVQPKEDADMIKGNFKYASYYLDIRNKHIVSVGKFYELPYIVARFSKLAGEVYGRSPAWSCLPDIQMVNTIRETQIRAAQLQAQPPLLVADDGVMNPIKAVPNGIIVGGLSMDGMQRVAPLNVGGNLGISDALVQQVQKSIRDSFYIDAFIFRDGPMMTATEVRSRQQEQLRLLAPHVGRIQSEFLQPLITKVFNIMLRSGMLGKLPDQINGMDYKIEYISPLAMLQKATSVQAIQSFIANIVPLVQINPDVLDVINFDEGVRKIAEDGGVPYSVLRSGKEIEAIRQQKAQMQQAQMALNAGQQMADIANKLPIA